MEDQCSPLNWPCYYQEEGMEELKHSLLYTNLELETTILYAQEELSRKSDEINHLKALLTKTTKERDEALAQCQTLTIEKLLLQQQQQQKQHLEDEAITNSSSGSLDNNAATSPPLPPPPPPPPPPENLVTKTPLPENGKFLQAVMEAGPLLQTLLLAGPLPTWQHPPPPLNVIEIPPVTISSPTPSSKKRGLVHSEYCCDGSNDFSPKTKNQKSCSTIMFDDKHLVLPHN